MLKELEIFYNDLTDEAKQRFDDIFGGADEFNHEISPLAIFSVESEDEENADD